MVLSDPMPVMAPVLAFSGPRDERGHQGSVEKTEEVSGHCNTWGNYHFKTFDGTTYTYPGTCVYTFASHCHTDYSKFDISIKRIIGEEGNRLYFTAVIENVVIDIAEEGITVDGIEISLPYTKNTIVIDDTCENFKITSRIGLTITWNWGDDLKLELDEKFKKRTCGLCASYDDNPMNDISWKGFPVSPILFGNIQKVNIPDDDCSDLPSPQKDLEMKNTCKKQMAECEVLLSDMGNCKNKMMSSYSDYLQTCKEDLCGCTQKNKTKCMCSTLNQFSKECALAGGHPGKWRRPDLCFINCPPTMEYLECVSPCPDSCTNPDASKLCNEHCTEGCSCPPGLLLDDVNHRKECVKQKMCPCMHSGKIYKPGESYSNECQQCKCIVGHWACTQLPCSGRCSLIGGSHISTFDKKEFTFHGNCQYVVSKDVAKKYAITGKIIQCGVSETVTCLNTVYITIGKVNIKICHCGNVYINNFITFLPKVKDGIILYKPSSYYISVVTPFGLSVQVQVKPVFQLFVSVNSTFKDETIGLCGNFNGVEADDLKTMSGIVEESASAYSNSWKVQASCSDVKDNLESPCSRSLSKEQYALYWCPQLTNTTWVFAECHPYLDPDTYLRHCIYDVCNSDHSEDSLCMWFSVYAGDCAHRGVLIQGWRQGVCDPKDSCPESMTFSYNVRPCNISCKSLAEPDPVCNIKSFPTEGCSCPKGTYMMADEKCVPPEKCPCSHKGRSVPAGESFRVDEVLCKCISGILDCPRTKPVSHECKSPMTYYDCDTAGSNATGIECQKSCKTQDMQCYSKECVSGCVCPRGLVSNDKGGCIPPNLCPCVYGGKFYETGEIIDMRCNKCTCMNRTWVCTDNPCPQSCTVYGNGHYSSFDGARFDFSGNCDYILAQDFCAHNSNRGSFRIIIENIPCGKSEVICSLGIKIILKNTTIELSDVQMTETNKDLSKEKPYMVDVIGLYVVLKTYHGLTFMWDKKTTAIVQLSSVYESTVCGLCGNYNYRANDDFTSSWRSLEENEEVFADSWKVRQGCTSGTRTEPCIGNPYKYPWAQKHCSLIKSDVFASCHVKVDPIPYYDSCVSDSCGCTEGGDCECLCTSLAAYAAACRKRNICISWRTPDICPVYCDYYNKEGQCMWHYKPCGAPCMVTCRNPMGNCDNQSYKLEGCYAVCSKDKPYFDEEIKACVPALQCTTCQIAPLNITVLAAQTSEYSVKREDRRKEREKKVKE
ncbi:mucin-5B-like [Discoglossus pictus]